MIDFASTRASTSRDAVPYLKLMAAIIAQAVSDATAELPPKLVESRAVSKAKEIEREKKRAEIKREAESAICFLFGNSGQFERIASFIGFDPKDMRTALIVGKDSRYGINQYSDSNRRILRMRLMGLGYDLRQYKTQMEPMRMDNVSEAQDESA